MSCTKKDFCKNSLCPKDYRELIQLNSNTTNLSDILDNWYKGAEIGSDNYMKKSSYRFLKTNNVTSNYYYDQNSIEFCKPFIGNKPQNNDILIVKDGAGKGLGEVSLYKNESINNDYISSGLIGIKIKSEKKYYALSLLKSQHFKDFVNVNTAQGSTIRHSKLIALEYPISFPTTKNHIKPELIEKYISILTQNVLDKEFQIELKNKQVDNLFKLELKSKTKKKVLYKFPTISKLKSGNRLDTIIYSERYFEYETLIKSYQNSYYFLNESEISPGRTPKDYYYSDTKKSNKFYEWVTPKNVNGRRLDYKTYIHTKSSTKISKNCIVLNGIRYVGNGIYIDTVEKIYSNQNTLIINKFKEKEEQIFLYTFLTSEIGKYMQMAQRNFGIVPILYTDNLCKIPIPKFDKDKKKEIVELYYNQVKVLEKNTLENYLENEKKRNELLGVHQLNDEIFILREKIENVIDKIIKEEPIYIEL